MLRCEEFGDGLCHTPLSIRQCASLIPNLSGLDVLLMEKYADE